MEKKTLLNLIAKAKEELKSSPENNIWVSKSNNCWQYYMHDGNNKQYLKKEEAKVYAQKRYCQAVLKEAQKQLQIKQKYEKEYRDNFLENIYSNLPEGIRVLVTPFHKTYSMIGEEWVNRSYRTKSISPETVTYRTNNGENVRSKSELIIANKLKELGIYYRYECQKYFRSYGFMYPDFTVLSPKTGKEVIIEHFGMMDNPDYANTFIRKMKTYNEEGLFPGHGLICFFETKELPLDVEIVEDTLKTMLFE